MLDEVFPNRDILPLEYADNALLYFDIRAIRFIHLWFVNNW